MIHEPTLAPKRRAALEEALGYKFRDTAWLEPLWAQLEGRHDRRFSFGKLAGDGLLTFLIGESIPNGGEADLHRRIPLAASNENLTAWLNRAGITRILGVTNVHRAGDIFEYLMYAVLKDSKNDLNPVVKVFKHLAKGTFPHRRKELRSPELLEAVSMVDKLYDRPASKDPLTKDGTVIERGGEIICLCLHDYQRSTGATLRTIARQYRNEVGVNPRGVQLGQSLSHRSIASKVSD